MIIADQLSPNLNHANTLKFRARPTHLLAVDRFESMIIAG
jgi:hypothetical protein